MSATNVRSPCRAGTFYPGTAAACARAIEQCRAQEAPRPAGLNGAHIYGGVIPHAGWMYSGPTALSVFDALAEAGEAVDTFVIFATAHRPEVRVPSLQEQGAWAAPGGQVELDAELAGAMLAEAGEDVLIARAGAHAGDHAIEVQVPFVLDTFPRARLVPVAVPHGDAGPALGAATARAVRKLGRRAVALASTDLTHYGPNYDFDPHGTGVEAHRWSKDVNDAAFLARVLALDAEGACRAGREGGSACGPAATAAALAFAKEHGATRGVLLEHITSWERDPSRGEPCDFVGYAGVVFL